MGDPSAMEDPGDEDENDQFGELPNVPRALQHGGSPSRVLPKPTQGSAHRAGIRISSMCAAAQIARSWSPRSRTITANGACAGDHITDTMGRTPLHLAAISGNFKAVKMLLSSRAYDVNTQDDSGKTPLHYALKNNKFELASILLDHGADFAKQSKSLKTGADYCYTLFRDHGSESEIQFRHFTQKHRHLLCAAMLKDGRHMLHTASYWDDTGTVRTLLDSGAGVSVRDDKGRTPLHFCFLNDDRAALRTAQTLVEHDGDINARDQDEVTPLHLLMVHRDGDEDTAQVFVKDVTVTQAQKEASCPLHIAAIHGDLQLLKYFSKCGVQLDIPDTEGFAALHLAALYGRADVIRLLLKRGASPHVENQRRQTALHYASVLPKITCAKMLLHTGASVECQDIYGMTPLHKAAGWGVLDTVRLLMHEGASINVCDNNEQLPIHLSAIQGSAEISELLILKGSEVHWTDANKLSPLHLAAKTGNSDIIKLLLLHGADPNAQDVKGHSPLHHACFHGNKEAVQTLINRGASKNILTNSGQKPEELALDRGYVNVLHVMREHRQSLTLYAPEQLRAFEMVRNATAPLLTAFCSLEDEVFDDEHSGHDGRGQGLSGKRLKFGFAAGSLRKRNSKPTLQPPRKHSSDEYGHEVEWIMDAASSCDASPPAHLDSPRGRYKDTPTKGLEHRRRSLCSPSLRSASISISECVKEEQEPPDASVDHAEPSTTTEASPIRKNQADSDANDEPAPRFADPEEDTPGPNGLLQTLRMISAESSAPEESPMSVTFPARKPIPKCLDGCCVLM